MYYIYQLLFDGVPYYIGVSNNPVLRYRQHCSNTNQKSRCFIEEKLLSGIFPKLEILSHCEGRDESFSLEEKYIANISNTTFLINTKHNCLDNLLKINSLEFKKSTFLKLPLSYYNAAIDSFNNYITKNSVNDRQIKKQGEKIINSDFSLAKSVFTTLEARDSLFISVDIVGNFRKYLRDHSKGTHKTFITKTVEGKLRITRLK